MNRVFTAREKILLVILVVLLLAAGYYWVIFTPVQKRIQTAEQVRLDIEDEMNIELAKAARLSEMKAAIKMAEQDSLELTSTIPDYDNLDRLVIQLDAILAPALDYDLSFQEITLDNNFIYRPVDMTFTCDGYASAREVVDNLYYCIYRCGLDNITVTTVQGENRGQGQEQEQEILDLKQSKVQISLTATFYENVPKVSLKGIKEES